jgi:hypothetical protein
VQYTIYINATMYGTQFIFQKYCIVLILICIMLLIHYLMYAFDFSAKMEGAHSEFIKVIKAAVCRYVPDRGVLLVIVSINWNATKFLVLFSPLLKSGNTLFSTYVSVVNVVV